MVDTNAIIQRMKTLLNIDDTIQDEALSIIVENVHSHLLLKLRRVNTLILEVPVELSFIVEEISIRRYNRLGGEGYKSESVEGHSVDYFDVDDYFKPYQSVIDDHTDDDYSSGRGRVRFI